MNEEVSFQQKTVEVGGKVVQISQPYNAKRVRLIGRERIMELITAAWIAGEHSQPLSPLLLGEPGVGKNHLVYELARRTGKELYIFQGHEDVTAEDLACAVRFSDDPGKKMDYIISPLVTAMKKGGICFIDEIAKIRPRALSLLVSVLDERRYIDSTLLGERIMAHEGFRFIAATNTADIEGSTMPEFIRSRLRPVIEVGYPSEDEIARIVKTRFPDLQKQVGPLLEAFWTLWGTQFSDGNVKSPTPRDVIYLFDLALSLSDFEMLNQRIGFAEAEHFPLTGRRFETTLSQENLETAFRELFQTHGFVSPTQDEP
jgi:MoxR-like ATPase